jgi:hypothetical protein
MSQSAIITSSPDVMSGRPVFAGTRVPVQTLLDYLKAGESIPLVSDWENPIAESLSELYFSVFGYKF